MSLQSDSDKREAAMARADKIHVETERFGYHIPREVLVAKREFPEWTPEQWAARLVIITAFATGLPVYHVACENSRPVWRRVTGACGFHGPVDSYSLNPPACQIEEETKQ